MTTKTCADGPLRSRPVRRKDATGYRRRPGHPGPAAQTSLLDAEEPGSIGAGMVLYPLSAFHAMDKAAENLCAAMRRRGHPIKAVGHMQTRDKLYDRIRYHDFEQQLDALFTSKK